MFLDEPGFMPTPTVRRALEPRGKTPIVRSRDRHDRTSAISAITVSPSRRRVGLYSRPPPDDVDVRGEGTVEFLRELRRQLPAPMTVLWNWGDVHDRSKAVRAYLAERPSIETEPFPANTPEAKPDEGVWGYTKYGRLANFAPEDTDGSRAAVVAELERLRRRPRPPASFVRHAGVPISLRL